MLASTGYLKFSHFYLRLRYLLFIYIYVAGPASASLLSKKYVLWMLRGSRRSGDEYEGVRKKVKFKNIWGSIPVSPQGGVYYHNYYLLLFFITYYYYLCHLSLLSYNFFLKTTYHILLLFIIIFGLCVRPTSMHFIKKK